MRCGRADEIEVEAFLVDSGGPEFAEFRAHYPGCLDCASEVARWSALGLALRDVLDAESPEALGHPEPEEIEAFVTAPATLGEGASRVARHLEACGACRTEIQLMERFDPAALLAAVSPATRAVTSAETAGALDWIRRAVSGLAEALFGGPAGRLALPSLALAICVLAAVWWSGRLPGLASPERPDANLQVAETPQTPPSRATPGTPQAAPTGEAAPTQPENRKPDARGSVMLAEGQPAARAAEAGGAEAEATPEDPARREGSPSATSPERVAAVESEPEARPDPIAGPPTGVSPRVEPPQIAQADERRAAPPIAPGPQEDAAPSAAAESDEILLAALTELPMPDYASPPDSTELAWMRQFGPVRSGATVLRVETRAPAGHAGLTLRRSPRLWWFIEETTPLPLQLTVVDEEAIDPILRVDLPGPHAAGLHSIDLTEHGIRLEPNKVYRWFVSVLVDPNRPSRNPISAGALRVVDASDARRLAVEEVPPSARGHRLAQLGIWYDAYDFFASLAQANPQVEGLSAYRDRLVELAGP